MYSVQNFKSWLLALCSLLFVGCVQQSTEQGTVPAGNKYATGFQITPTDTGTIVEVFQPYQRVCIQQPMRRLGTMSTVQVGFLDAIDAKIVPLKGHVRTTNQTLGEKIRNEKAGV